MKPIKTHTVRILWSDGTITSVRYRITPLDYAGCCDDPVKIPDREIVLDYSVCDREFLRIATHELMHALDWNKNEAKVHNDSKELARWLWRLGYRRMT